MQTCWNCEVELAAKAFVQGLLGEGHRDILPTKRASGLQPDPWLAGHVSSEVSPPQFNGAGLTPRYGLHSRLLSKQPKAC